MLSGINCITSYRQLFDNCRLANTLWADVSDEDDIASVSTTWSITLEKMGCDFMVRSGQTSFIYSMLQILLFWQKLYRMMYNVLATIQQKENITRLSVQ